MHDFAPESQCGGAVVSPIFMKNLPLLSLIHLQSVDSETMDYPLFRFTIGFGQSLSAPNHPNCFGPTVVPEIRCTQMQHLFPLTFLSRRSKV
jgi:hypothetical protein